MRSCTPDMYPISLNGTARRFDGVGPWTVFVGYAAIRPWVA